MPKSTRNAGKRWTDEEIEKLRALAAVNTPTRVIGIKLGRPEGRVEAKADELDISLKPTNQSPYGPRKR